MALIETTLLGLCRKRLFECPMNLSSIGMTSGKCMKIS